MRLGLTKSIADNIQPGQFINDSKVGGFAVRCTPAGHVSFVLRYRTLQRRQRMYTIGSYGSPWTVEGARKEALRLLGEIVEGRDPSADKAEKRNAVLLQDFAEEYLKRHAWKKKKPRSAEGDETNLRLHIKPAMGKRALTSITKIDIAKLHGKMHATPATANRCLALLSKMFSVAEDWGYIEDGRKLFKGIQKYPERRKQRFLADHEITRLASAIDAMRESDSSSLYFLAMIQLLLLTGARLSEIATLRWEHVDLGNARLSLPDSKTGAKGIPLSEAAVALLEGLPRIEGNPHVLPGRKTGSHLVGVQKAWQRLRRAADLNDVRIHDLRHTFASVMARNGASLIQIGHVLGHRHASTSARYAHLTPNISYLAANDASKIIDASFKPPGSSASSVPGVAA